MRRPRRRGERGIALALVGIALVAIFAMIVIAVDVGRFAHTGAEVQAVADLAALSGAKQVLAHGAGTAQAGGDTAARQNSFDGRAFINDGTIATMPVEEGCYTRPAAGCTTNCMGTFAVGAPPCPAGQFQAVRATATGNTVRIITAALLPINLGLQSLNVTKQAIAAIVGGNTTQGTLPVVFCPTLLTQLQPGGTCVQDAVMAQNLFVPDPSGNSCYSSLSPTDAASAQRFNSLLPASCGGTATAVVSAGESVLVQNGADTSFLQALHDCVASGVTDYTIPVVSTCGCTGSATITGFVTLRIADASQVVATGPAANKGIHNAVQLCNNNIPTGGSSPGTGLYGSQGVAMMQ
jgi:putative Flp pilus-assembly TadE/G-like protein